MPVLLRTLHFRYGNQSMKKNLLCFLMITPLFVSFAQAQSNSEEAVRDIPAIKKAALYYIESQHETNAKKMEFALHPKVAKRTYWKKTDGNEHIIENNYQSMLQVAQNYNKSGTKFAKHPKKIVEILDHDKRVATVKLIADEWIDYMHLIKQDNGQWKVINVLWQYHDISRHDKSK